MRLLEEAHVGVVPGTDFRAPGFGRFSYATSTANVREALQRIEALLD
jgi:aspartate aminotransferase